MFSLSYSKLLFRIQFSAFHRENFSSWLRRKSGFPVFNLSNELLGYFWVFEVRSFFFKGVCCNVVEFCGENSLLDRSFQFLYTTAKTPNGEVGLWVQAIGIVLSRKVVFRGWVISGL